MSNIAIAHNRRSNSLCKLNAGNTTHATNREAKTQGTGTQRKDTHGKRQTNREEATHYMPPETPIHLRIKYQNKERRHLDRNARQSHRQKEPRKAHKAPLI